MSQRLDVLKAQLARQLYLDGCVKKRAQSPEGKGFRLKLHEKHPDAPLSPIYFNLRTPQHPEKPGTLSDESVRLIGECFAQVISDEGLEFDPEIDYVAGIPYAGEPLAIAFVRSLRGDESTLLLLGKETKDGKRCIVPTEQSISPDLFVFIVDDVITHADSKIEAISAIQSIGGKVTTLLVVVDREQGGMRELPATVEGHAIFTVTELMQLYLQLGMFTQEEHDEVIAYCAAN